MLFQAEIPFCLKVSALQPQRLYSSNGVVHLGEYGWRWSSNHLTDWSRWLVFS